MLCQYAFVSCNHLTITSLFVSLLQWGSAFLLTGDLKEQKKHLEVYNAYVAFRCSFCSALCAVAFHLQPHVYACRPW